MCTDKDKDPYSSQVFQELISENKGAFVMLTFTIILLVLLQFLIYKVFCYEMSMYVDKKLLIEEERDQIVENLEEAIISRSGNAINFTNILGFKIMQNIFEFSNL